MGLPLPVMCFKHGVGGVVCVGGRGRERRAGTENRVAGLVRGENIIRKGIPNGVRGDKEQKAVGVMTGHEGTGKTVDGQFPLG